MRLLLDVGCRLERTGELTLDTMPVELLLARSPRVADSLRERVLRPIEDYPGRRSSDRRGPDLRQTLEVFLEAGLDRRVAAERLHVHPNTLNYRLGRIEELTGLDLTDPEDLMLTALALRRDAIA
jgi:DNA-binding PucR family transcriptional regulator